MTYWVDEAIGKVTQKLKDEGIWDDTLVVVHADNGGPVYGNGGHDGAANNYPLKGGKMANWEGGIRVNAFVSGGYLPEKVRGTKNDGLMTGWDWYATFAGLAGVDPTDYRAQKAGLPPVDSHDLWPHLTGAETTSPRKELAIGDLDGDANAGPRAKTLVGGLITDGYKLLLGTNAQAGWTGPRFPNTTKHWNPSTAVEHCGR